MRQPEVKSPKKLLHHKSGKKFLLNTHALLQQMFMGTILINKRCYLTIIGIPKVPQISQSDYLFADKASSKTRYAFPLSAKFSIYKAILPTQ
jgi:hypothetical protein